jgi:hypothetical protein
VAGYVVRTVAYLGVICREEEEGRKNLTVSGVESRQTGAQRS